MSFLRHGLLFVLMSLGTAVIYYPARNRSWDSDDFIWLYQASQRQTWQDLFHVNYFWSVRPLTQAFFWLGFRWFGLDPTGYHVLTMAVHVLTLLLIYRLVRSLTGSEAGGVTASLAFLLYSQHGPTLAWTSAVGEVLAVPCTIGSLALFLATRERFTWTRYGGSLLLGLTALLSKESAVILPILLLLAELILLPAPRCWRYHIPFWALTGTIVVWERLLLSLEQSGTGERRLNPEFLGGVAAAFRYCCDLIMSHSGVYALEGGGWSPTCYWVLGVAWALVTWRLSRRAPVAAFFLCWIPITYLPYAAFVPGAVLYDWYAYIPSVGLAGLCGWLADVASRHPKRIPIVTILVVYLAWQGSSLLENIWANASNRLTPDDQANVRLALRTLGPRGSIYIYNPPGEVPFEPYEVAMYAGLPLGRFRGWYDMLELGAIPAADVALYYDRDTDCFFNLTPSVQHSLQELTATGNYPLKAPAATEVRYQWDFNREEDRRQWQPGPGLQPSGGAWRTESGRAALLGPDLDAATFPLYSIQVDCRLQSPVSHEAMMALAWGTDRGEGLKMVRKALQHHAARQTVTLYPSRQRAWWDGGHVRRLYLVPCTESATVQIESIRIWSLGPGSTSAR